MASGSLKLQPVNSFFSLVLADKISSRGCMNRKYGNIKSDDKQKLSDQNKSSRHTNQKCLSLSTRWRDVKTFVSKLSYPHDKEIKVGGVSLRIVYWKFWHQIETILIFCVV